MKQIINILLITLTATIFFSCGKKESKLDYRMDQDGLVYKSGSTELYTGVVSDTSDVIITFEVVNGIKNGAFITYYLDGKYEKYGMIDNDKNEGEWSYFYPNGQLESKGSYVKNKPNGLWISYYPDGKIKSKGEYLFGNQHGRWSYFDQNGELINMFIFGDGELLESLKNS